MASRLKVLLFLSLFLLGNAALHAQDIDYLKHRKTFDLCSIKKDCNHCFECSKERFLIKVKDNSNKKIVSVFYKFYSPVYNRVLEKEAKIIGGKIEKMQTGLFYVCVIDVRHWFISKIVYDDESSTSFVLHERMENFLQEPDECDCND
jgi:hypothetical protein